MGFLEWISQWDYQIAGQVNEVLRSKVPRKRVCFIAAIFVIQYLYSQNRLFNAINPNSPISSRSSTDSANNIIVNKEKSKTITGKRQRRRISGGFLTTHTGCRICKWVYSQEKYSYKECKDQSPDHELRQQHLQENDTIYVPFSGMQKFVNKVLNDISVNVVIISGQTHKLPKLSENTLATLLNHPRVLFWFCQNLSIFGYPHQKIRPFPYGLKETGHKGKLTFEAYKRVYFKHLNNNNTNTNMTAYDNKKKKTLVYAGPLGKTNPARGSIPQSNRKLHPEAYFTKIAESQYILSPNGDRPDCFRHYEALGLGTIPITELDPVLYYHLKGGPVVFGNNDWNMESLLERLHDRAVKKEQMVVNRNLVREDYWMDWVEEEVGIGELNWRVLNETLLFDSGEENRTALTNVSVGRRDPL